MQGLEAQWKQLRLSEEEQEPLIIEDVVSEDDKVKEERSLVGKIHMDRKIGKETIRGNMGNIWRLSKLAVFKVAEQNIFIITFTSVGDKLSA